MEQSALIAGLKDDINMISKNMEDGSSRASFKQLEKVMDKLHPDEDFFKSLNKISRLNRPEIFYMSLSRPIDTIRKRNGLKPRYTDFNRAFLALKVSLDGKGREESIETLKIAKENAEMEEQKGLLHRYFFMFSDIWVSIFNIIYIFYGNTSF